ncbi:MAG TPA: hypothetical protein VIJ87_00145, partial [Pyrinomonadaceae bacterium]
KDWECICLSGLPQELEHTERISRHYDRDHRISFLPQSDLVSQSSDQQTKNGSKGNQNKTTGR